MEKKQYIVIGEAPESDSEEEVNVPATNSSHGKRTSDPANPQGIVIAGEAPESDDEDKVSVSSISSATSISSIASFSSNIKRSTIPDKTKKQENVKYSSLLHRKLRERNVSLHRNVVEFIHHNVGLASRDLGAANQQLLKSQLQLQEVALSLHTLHTNLSQLQNKLASATSTTFLSRINIRQ
ncbi:Biogenesis of lysosome-related organelles complex 1 subunit 3 [Gryllus bimaculatus]|nr:Biogenesis of lysosome-related organelles complex 1 subunit 3 [Gryllus bimaculatus]